MITAYCCKVFAAGMLIGCLSGQIGGISPRDLFYQKAGPSATGDLSVARDALAMRLGLLLVNGNRTTVQRVSFHRSFKVGDCIALEAEANRGGTLYVLSRNSAKDWDVLYPNPDIRDGNSFLEPHVKRRVPAKHCFEIEGDSLEETLLVVFSRSRSGIGELDAAIRKLATSSGASGLAGRGFRIVEVDTPSAGEPEHAAYVAAADQANTNTVFAEIRLKRR